MVLGKVGLLSAKCMGARTLNKLLTVGLVLFSRRGINIKYLLDSSVLRSMPDTECIMLCNPFMNLLK